MKITRQLLRDWKACYDDKEIARHVPESGLAPLEVLDLAIPAADRLWVVLHEGIMPARELRLLACAWARRALERERAAGRAPDARSWAAVETAARHARGDATGAELAAANAAARAAAGFACWSVVSATADSAAGAATIATADSAAGAAGWAAGWAPARAAAGFACWSAASDAASDAERGQQIADVRAVLQRLI